MSNRIQKICKVYKYKSSKNTTTKSIGFQLECNLARAWVPLLQCIEEVRSTSPSQSTPSAVDSAPLCSRAGGQLLFLSFSIWLLPLLWLLLLLSTNPRKSSTEESNLKSHRVFNRPILENTIKPHTNSITDTPYNAERRFQTTQNNNKKIGILHSKFQKKKKKKTEHTCIQDVKVVQKPKRKKRYIQ